MIETENVLIISYREMIKRFKRSHHLVSMSDIQGMIIVDDFDSVNENASTFLMNLIGGCLEDFNGFPAFFDKNGVLFEYHDLVIRAEFNCLTSLKGLPRHLKSLHLNDNSGLMNLDNCPVVDEILSCGGCQSLENVDSIYDHPPKMLSLENTNVSRLPRNLKLQYLSLTGSSRLSYDDLDTIETESLGLDVRQFDKFRLMNLHSLLHQECRVRFLGLHYCNVFNVLQNSHVKESSENVLSVLNNDKIKINFKDIFAKELLKPGSTYFIIIANLIKKTITDMTDPFEFQDWCIDNGLEKLL